VRRRGEVRHLLEKAHVLRVPAELKIADQQAERCAAEGAVLFLVDLLEELALVKLDRLIEVLLQLGPGGIEHADLERGPGLGVGDEIGEAAPGCWSSG
jgi:hypothetical protein